MIKQITTAAIATVAIAAGSIATAAIYDMAPASAASLSPTAKTCAAFATWNHSKTPAHLNTLMADSITAPWHVLGTDVVVLYTDVRDHDTYDAPADAQAIAHDCK